VHSFADASATGTATTESKEEASHCLLPLLTFIPAIVRVLPEAGTEFAFAEVGRHLDWRGVGEQEVGIDTKTGGELVRVDRRYFRPTEVDDLLGDASKAHRKLGWRSETSFAELVAEMVKSDLKAIAEEAGRRDRGSY
jgi:GDP-mannose 4,6 dehydratase